MREIEEAARRGDKNLILQELKKNPDLLSSLSSRNLVQIASKYGKHNVVMELLAQKPSLADERNEDGHCSIHLAAAHGYELVVLEHLKLQPNLCSIRDNIGWTALHWATIKGRINVIRVLLGENLECIKSLTFRRESCFHLAVQYNQSEAFRNLVYWLEQLNYRDMESMVNLRDRDGFAVLHRVILRNQYQALETMTSSRIISRALQINITDGSGQTPLDLYYQYSNEPDKDVGEMLYDAGAFRARRPRPLIHNENVRKIRYAFSLEELARFRRVIDRRIPIEIIGFLLQFLGAILIASLQAVNNNPFDSSSSEYFGEQRFHYIGDVLRGYGQDAQVFYAMMTNSTMFIGSTILIQLLLLHLPIHIPLFILLLSMIVYYFIAMKRSLPHFIIICGPYHIKSLWLVWIGVLIYGVTAFGVTTFLVLLSRQLLQRVRGREPLEQQGN